MNNIDYVFFERPLHKPLADTNQLLKQLDKAVEPFGFVPLSLKYFYRMVGGVDFAWDYYTNDEIRWPMADPIQIYSLDELISIVTDEDWQEDIGQYVEDKSYGYAFLDLAADNFHKDNISGGPPYSLQITKVSSIDSDFLYESHDTTFINYLRICLDSCGFPGISNPEDEQGFKAFYNRVKPQLKKI